MTTDLLRLSSFDTEELSRLAIEHKNDRFTYRDLLERFSRIKSSNPFVATRRLDTAFHFLKSLEDQTAFFPVSADALGVLANALKSTTTDAQLLLATSGTTGAPKIVCLSASSLLFSAMSFNKALKCDESDKWLCALPLHHIAGLSILTRSMLTRTTVVLHDRFDTKKVTSAIDDGVTLVSMVPTMLQKIFDHSNWAAPDHLKAVLLGGAMVPGTLLEEAKSRHIPIVRSYGMTETASGIALDGMPFPGVELKVDSDRLLHIKSPSLMQGYLNGTNTEQWFKTKDLAHLENGKVTILGRADDMLISGGENISPSDVECCFLDLEMVKAVQAVGIPDETWGQLVGLIVKTDHPEKALEHIKSRLAGMPAHLRPRSLSFVEGFETTHTGKIRRIDPNTILDWIALK